MSTTAKALAHALAAEAQIRAAIEAAPDRPAARTALHDLTVARTVRAVPDDTTVEPAMLGCQPVERITPPLDPEGRVILYLHGGGWALGDAMSVRETSARIARHAQSRVLTLDYPLAPEHPFPSALNTVVASYRSLLALGTDPRRIALAGESAGANLALATALCLRDSGDAVPGALALISPIVDLTPSALSTGAVTKDPTLPGESLRRLALEYVASAPSRNPLISPVYADLAGVPPMLLHVGTADVVLEQVCRLANRAQQAGVDVTYREWEGMFHGWQRHPYLPAAIGVTTELGERLLIAIGPSAVPVH